MAKGQPEALVGQMVVLYFRCSDWGVLLLPEHLLYLVGEKDQAQFKQKVSGWPLSFWLHVY